MTRRATLAALAGAAAVAAVPRAARAQAVTLRLGHVLAPTHQFHTGMELAAAELDRATQGRVRLEVFPSSQLGTERDMHVAIRTGSIDMLLGSPGGASVHLKELSVLDAPYLFRDNAHWQSVVYGAQGADWEARTLAASGVRIVGWFHRGTRHVVSRGKPYNTIADMAGQKIRVADLPPYPQVFAALGASPTPIAFAEMYGALQAGTVDGADAPLDTILSQKLYEVSKYVNLIAWSFAAPGTILIAESSFQQLSADDQAALRAALRAGSDHITEAFTAGEERVKAELVANGMVLVTPTDPEAWAAAAAAAIPGLAATWGGDAALYDRIRAAG
jgi:tripartite ATP-independent transporter DctP family solute receptor